MIDTLLELPEHVQRMIAEYLELADKMRKLTQAQKAFEAVDGEKAKNQKELLRRRRKGMNKYLLALEERINKELDE